MNLLGLQDRNWLESFLRRIPKLHWNFGTIQKWVVPMWTIWTRYRWNKVASWSTTLLTWIYHLLHLHTIELQTWLHRAMPEASKYEWLKRLQISYSEAVSLSKLCSHLWRSGSTILFLYSKSASLLQKLDLVTFCLFRIPTE